MSQNFKPAPMAGVAIVSTVAFVGVFLYLGANVVLALTAGAYPTLFDVGGAIILGGFMLFAWARSVKNYRVREGELTIERMAMKGVAVPLSMVKSAQSNPDIGSFFNRSMLGTGGLFGWGGKARVRNVKDINAIEAYVYGANPKKSVLFRLNDDRLIIVTPADPQGLLAAIREAGIQQRSLGSNPSNNPTNPSKKKRRQ